MEQEKFHKQRRHSQEILRTRETYVKTELQDIYRHIANSDFSGTKLWIKKNEQLAFDYKATLIEHAKRVIEKPEKDKSNRECTHLVLQLFAGGTKAIAGIAGIAYGLKEDQKVYSSLCALLVLNGTKECFNAFANRDELEKNALAIQALVTAITYKK
jgi:hypothetical protein